MALLNAVLLFELSERCVCLCVKNAPTKRSQCKKCCSLIVTKHVRIKTHVIRIGSAVRTANGEVCNGGILAIMFEWNTWIFAFELTNRQSTFFSAFETIVIHSKWELVGDFLCVLRREQQHRRGG